MESLESYFISQNGLLLIAPPGWGKTYKLLHWAKKSQFSFIYLSPLRALSEEVYLKSVQLMKGVIFVRTRFEYEKFVQSGSSFKLFICAFEIFDDRLLNKPNTIFVLDEFHLIYHWGDHFRERLSEVYEMLFSHAVKVLLLTATMTQINLTRLKQDASLNYENFHMLNLGNHLLKNHPRAIYYYPKILVKLLMRNFERELEVGNNDSILLFCKYRSEVKEYTKKYSKKYSVLSCVGGETKDFSLSLQACKTPPKLIISTTCLSHGVNLPKISRIYFSYRVDDQDFYTQMVGRGGRKGEEYVVHCLEKGHLSFSSFFRLLKISMILKLKKLGSILRG